MSSNPYIKIIEALPGAHLLILSDAPKFTMVAASADYFFSRNKTQGDIAGKGIFERFPENPDHPNESRTALTASFQKVIKEKKKDKLDPIRYDLEIDGKFEERYWAPVNSPVLDDEGNVMYILHSAEDVTHKIKAAQTEELVEGMKAAHNIFTQTPIPICILKGPDLIVELANDPTLELWGKGREAIGKRLMDAVPEVRGQGYVEMMTEVLTTGKPHEVYESPVTLIRNGKEELLYINYIYQPYYENDTTKAEGVLAIGNDVTERVAIRKELAEKNKSLKESNEKLNGFLEAVPQMVWTNKPDGEIDFYNHQWFKYTGLNFQQSKKWGWQQVVHPDDLSSTFATYTERLQKGEEVVIENRFRRHDGEYRWHLSRAIPIKNNNGTIRFWIGTSTDIHDRKLAEDALKQSEQQIRSLVESAPFPIGVYIGKEMRIQLTNQAIIDTWDKGSDLIGKTYAQVLPELSNQHIYQQLDDVYTTGIPFHAKNQRVDLLVDGQLKAFYFNYSFTPLFTAAGEVYGVMNTAADVTDLAIAKQKIEISEQNLKNIILEAPAAMCILKGSDYIVDIANERMFEILGKKGRELLHKPLFEGLPEAKNQGFEQILENVYNSGETFTAIAVPVSLPRQGKLEDIYLNFVYEAFRGDSGEITGIMVVAVEVTQQVLAQKKIEEVVALRTKELADANQELVNTNASLEQFAYAASHDMQEPLRKIETFTNLLEREKGQLSDKGKSLLTKIGTSTGRMKTIINDLLQYSHQKFEGTHENVDLNEVVTQVKNDLEIAIQDNDVLIQAAHLPSINAIKGQINQLFYNLISNSIKFARKDTRPHIEINVEPLSKEDIAARRALNAHTEYIRITFKDNGIGFEQQYADKIFQLFTRLHGKAEYEGTGIGLGLCKKIVQNHHGDIYANSEIGKGATFNVILPVNPTI